MAHGGTDAAITKGKPMEQKETPWLNAVEKARAFAPPYDTELWQWDLNPADWEHICPARFGEGRPCGFVGAAAQTNWSGDSYRYDIYQRDGGKHYALRWQNGGGCGWLVSMNEMPHGEWNLLEMIVNMPVEARRWDACHFLWQCAYNTAMASARSERDAIHQAFVEGRLKKHKVRGRGAYRVEILPRIAESA